MTIRPATDADLPEMARIQSASPEASQWDPASYLKHNCLIACNDENVLGFLVTRQTASDEHEILNLAVDPPARRQGVAGILVEHVLKNLCGACFLEVRASSAAALALYRSLGFAMAGRRRAYYQDPSEDGIVMKFNS